MSESSDVFWLPTIVDACERWLRRHDYVGIDPFDGLTGSHLPPTLRSRQRSRQAVIQAAKRSPMDLRPILGVPPRRIAKALGLIASGYAALAYATGEGVARERAQPLLSWLEEARVREGGLHAWGYEFDVQTRWAFYPAGTPNIIATTFIANALLDWYERDGDEHHLDVGGAAAQFIAEELLVCDDGVRYIGYVPGVTTLIHNANALGCALLARAGSLAGRDDWVRAARDAAEVTIAAQDARGLWPYGEGAKLAWVDGFHAAYVLDALYTLWQATGDDGVLAAVQRGIGAYMDELFAPGDVPKYTDARLYPIDIHCASSAVDLFVRLRALDDRCWGKAQGVARWAIAEMWDPRGFFYYQKTRWYTNKIPYIRWSQAHMFRALARMLAAEAEQ